MVGVMGLVDFEGKTLPILCHSQNKKSPGPHFENLIIFLAFPTSHCYHGVTAVLRVVHHPEWSYGGPFLLFNIQVGDWLIAQQQMGHNQ